MAIGADSVDRASGYLHSIDAEPKSHNIENPRPAPEASQAQTSLPDSGYGTSSSSPGQNENCTKGERDISIPQKAIPFPLANQKELLVFKKEVDRGTIARFNEVVPEIERLLLSHIKSNRIFSNSTRYKPMAIRLMVLGKTESDAEECIVVFCPADLVKRVEQFFKKDQIVRELCKPRDNTAPSFNVIVNAPPPRLRALLSDIQVRCASSQSMDDTFCGKPIKFVNGTGEFRMATFGGIIKVTGSNGEIKLLGMTAGHALLEWEYPESGTDHLIPGSTMHTTLNGESKSVKQRDDSVEDRMQFGNPVVQVSTTPVQLEHEEAAEAWLFPESQELGRVLKTSNCKVGVNDEDVQYFDWAIFELNTYWQNELRRTELSGKVRKHQLLLASEKLSPDSPSQQVTMMGGSQGAKSGVLSKLPGRIIMGPGGSFVDAYLLTLDDGQGKLISALG